MNYTSTTVTFEVVQNDRIENTQTVVSSHASERAAMRSVRAEILRQNAHNRKYARFLNYSIRVQRGNDA